MSKSKANLRRFESLMMLGVALAMLPLALFTGYLGWLAIGEAAKFRDAPALPPVGATAGTFYQHSGQPEGQFLNPPDYPEVKDALQFQVRRERPDNAGSGWTQVAMITAARLSRVTIAGQALELKDSTRILGPTDEAFRPLPGGDRLHIEATRGAALPYIAYGIFDGVRLGDGHFDRLYLVESGRNAQTIDMMTSSGRIKGVVLSVVAALALLLSVMALKPLLKRRAP